jgi:hypothetical protein
MTYASERAQGCPRACTRAADAGLRYVPRVRARSAAAALLLQATGQWYEIQDLHVQETLPQLIALSESYMMIYPCGGCAGHAPARVACFTRACARSNQALAAGR